MRIEIFGSPGSGKSAIANQLSHELQIPYVSLGEITRREVALGTELGSKIKEYWDKNVFYPSGFLLPIIDKYLFSSETVRGFVLDGYPRLYSEALELEGLLKERNLDLDLTIILHLSLKEALGRIKNRLYCYTCHKQYDKIDVRFDKGVSICNVCGGKLVRREDDRQKILRERYRDFENEKSGVATKLFELSKSTIELDAIEPLNSVVAKIKKHLKY